MSDPAEVVQGAADPSTGAAGGPAPAAGETAEAKIARLEADNAKLRDERRADRAGALGAAHGLTKTQIELLAAQPVDKQEALAKQIADEVKGIQSTPAATAATAPAVGAPAAPGPDLSAPDPEKERQQAAFSSDGGQQPVVPPATESLQDRMNKAMSEAKSFEEMEEVQARFKAEQREARAAQRDALG